jgi:hypothetical protein
MQGRTDLQTALVRSRMMEREAEAARDRLAAAARANGRTPVGDRLRRWLGWRLVLAGAAIARGGTGSRLGGGAIGRDGLVEGSGEPIARTSAAAARPDPCLDAESTLGHAA